MILNKEKLENCKRCLKCFDEDCDNCDIGLDIETEIHLIIGDIDYIDTIEALWKELDDLKNRKDIEELRDLVWSMDVPHSTVPEYIELHEKMQSILKFIDERLLGKENI